MGRAARAISTAGATDRLGERCRWDECIARRYGIQRLAEGRRKQRFSSYLQTLLASGLPVLPYDREAALWHGEQRARLEACGLNPPFADGQIAAIAATQGLVLVTRNTSDFVVFQGLQILNWFS